MVKITQEQRVDGIKAKERTEKGHMHGAAAADDKIGCMAQAVAGVTKEAGSCEVEQRKQQIGRQHRQKHLAEKRPLVVIGVAVVADEDISRNKHYQGYGKERDNIQQHFRNRDPGFGVGIGKVPGGVHQHNAQNDEAT